jgi:outer membrane protein TolC
MKKNKNGYLRAFILALIFSAFLSASPVLYAADSSFIKSPAKLHTEIFLKTDLKNGGEHKTAVKAADAAKTMGEKTPEYITLRDALKFALKLYPGILTSKYSYISTIYTKNQTLSQYYPQVSGTAGFSRNSFMDVNQNSVLTGGQIVNRQGINYSLNDYSAVLNASYMLYSFGSRYYNYLGAKYQMKAAASGYNYNVNNDLYSVIINFAEYFADKELMQSDKENLKNDKVQYKAAAAFYRVGTGDLLDAETAKAAMETAKAAYINSIFNVKIAWLAIINSIGLAPSKKYRFVNTLKFKPFKDKLGSLMQTAFKYNPQLKQAVYEVKASEASVKESDSGYFPTFNANFSYAGENSSFPLNRNYSAGLSVSIPIFNGFLTQNKIDYSKAQLNSSIWNKRLTKNNLTYTVSGDYYGVKNQYLTVKALKSSAKASRLAYRLALKSYEVGVGSMVQLVTANALYISAETSYITGRYTYFYLKAKLYADLGLMVKHYIK